MLFLLTGVFFRLFGSLSLVFTLALISLHFFLARFLGTLDRILTFFLCMLDGVLTLLLCLLCCLFLGFQTAFRLLLGLLG